ncbi:MAG: gliding motility-associated ABC transporter permease subunit GldF [Flavobacteriaceae bacterium]
MWAIFKREITSFFASPIAYLIIAIFLVINGLFLWVFQGGFNIFDYGFADLSNFFLLAPWIMLLLIPAVCMKSFSEEMRSGTLELLYISPVSLWRLVLAKYFAALALTTIAILPTLIYIYSLSQLGSTIGNIDIGLALGSYIGLLFLISTYTGISLFTSSVTDNQIVAFIGGIIICFILFYLSEGLATLASNADAAIFLQNLGLKERFETMAGGILDTRDVVYFLSLSFLFLYLTVVQLKNRNR